MSWIEDEYAGRRQLLRHWAALYHMHAGAWRAEREIDWPAVRRLVFICAGNICRSPYGEARARQLGIATASSGLTAIDGAPANPSALENARRRNLDLTPHRSQPFSRMTLARGDLLVMFEPAHAAAVAQSARDAGAQVTLIGLWVAPRRPYVADPYGKNDAYFQKCFSLIDDALASAKNKLS